MCFSNHFGQFFFRTNKKFVQFFFSLILFEMHSKQILDWSSKNCLTFVQLTSLAEISEILNISILNLMKSECFDYIELEKLKENNWVTYIIWISWFSLARAQCLMHIDRLECSFSDSMYYYSIFSVKSMFLFCHRSYRYDSDYWLVISWYHCVYILTGPSLQWIFSHVTFYIRETKTTDLQLRL